jgi:hypothetical protein
VQSAQSVKPAKLKGETDLRLAKTEMSNRASLLAGTSANDDSTIFFFFDDIEIEACSSTVGPGPSSDLQCPKILFRAHVPARTTEG